MPSLAAQTTVAIIEDEMILQEELTFQLRHLGYEVEAFTTAVQLYRRLAVSNFDVILLDIGLPGEDGLSICNYLREHDQRLGIIFTTARVMREDRLTGLKAGADAYLCKPLDIDELNLLIKRVTVRAMQSTPAQRQSDMQSAAENSWRMDGGDGFLVAPSGLRVRLSINESRLMSILLNKPGEVISIQELAMAIGLLPGEYDKHRLEVVVSRLRDKVLRETGMGLPLQTRRGAGYLFA
jgi:DNA-binding response OmpR family regulator